MWALNKAPVMPMSSVLHDDVKSDIVAFIGSIIDGGHGANFQSSLDFGGVVDQELYRNQILTLLYINGKGSISDAGNLAGD